MDSYILRATLYNPVFKNQVDVLGLVLNRKIRGQDLTGTVYKCIQIVLKKKCTRVSPKVFSQNVKSVTRRTTLATWLLTLFWSKLSLMNVICMAYLLFKASLDLYHIFFQ